MTSSMNGQLMESKALEISNLINRAGFFCRCSSCMSL
jgi:hypothetical protein